MRTILSILTLSLVVATSACFDPDLPDNAFRCDESENKGCPAGFTCVAGTCRKGDSPTVDMGKDLATGEGVVADSTVDGGDTDASVDGPAVDSTSDAEETDSTVDGVSADATHDTLSHDSTHDTLSHDSTHDTLALDTRVDATIDGGIPSCPSIPVPLDQVVSDGPSRFDITVSSAGVPHIIVARSPAELNLVTIDGVVSSETLTPTGHHAGVTFDGSGQLHLVYSNAASSDLMYHMRRDTSGNWGTPRELRIGYGVIVNSLDVDARGSAVIAIGEGDRPDGWSQKLVVNLAQTNPSVCSGTLGSGANRFAHVRVAVGPSWTVETRHQGSDTSGYVYQLNWPNDFDSSVSCLTTASAQIASNVPRTLLVAAMDGADMAHTVYVDSATPPQLHYLKWDGTASNTPAEQTPVSGALPISVDIAASASGTAYIAYQNVDGGGNLRLHMLERSTTATRNPTLATGVGHRTRVHFDGTNVHLVTSDVAGKLYYLCHTPDL